MAFLMVRMELAILLKNVKIHITFVSQDIIWIFTENTKSQEELKRNR